MKEIKNKDNKDNKNNNDIIVMENMSDDSSSSDRTPPKVRITKQDIEAVFENEDGGAN